MNSTSRAVLQAIQESDSSLSLVERSVIQRLIAGTVEAAGGTARALEPPMLVSQRDAARLLSVSRATIWRIAKDRQIRQTEILPGTIRYFYEDLVASAQQGARSAAADPARDISQATMQKWIARDESEMRSFRAAPKAERT